jgi:predicted lactoylglutathione lyase
MSNRKEEQEGVPVASAVDDDVAIRAVAESSSVAMLLQDMHYQRIAALEAEMEDTRQQTEA